MLLWRISDGKYKTDYIRANSLDEAKIFFEKKYPSNKAVEFVTEHKNVYAVYFSDNLYDPAFFKGTKTQAIKGAKTYIRQWQLNAVINRIETR